ncbi:LysR family transcriptional regulator [Rhizobium leguminosarum bv. viciae]|nr:LysR family transcriptional regulator [Rhizobium leguminosarum bv. viciae]
MKSLMAFEEFGRLGTMTAAAESLGITVGAVSQHIKSLEKTVGISLVTRAGNSVKLTSAGQSYRNFLARGFQEFQDAQDAVRKIRSTSSITVSSLRSLAAKWLAPRMVEWQKISNGAKARLQGDLTEPNLENGDADFRITYGRHIEPHRQYSRLFTDIVLPVYAPGFKGRELVTRPEHLLQLPLIEIEWADSEGQSPGWSQWASVHCKSAPFIEPTLVFSFTNAALDAALYGEGVVLAQLSMVWDDIVAGRLIVPFDLRLPMPHPYYVAWSSAAFDKPAGREFHRWILSKGRQQGDLAHRSVQVHEDRTTQGSRQVLK